MERVCSHQLASSRGRPCIAGVQRSPIRLGTSSVAHVQVSPAGKHRARRRVHMGPSGQLRLLAMQPKQALGDINGKDCKSWRLQLRQRLSTLLEVRGVRAARVRVGLETKPRHDYLQQHCPHLQPLTLECLPKTSIPCASLVRGRRLRALGAGYADRTARLGTAWRGLSGPPPPDGPTLCRPRRSPQVSPPGSRSRNSSCHNSTHANHRRWRR